MVARDGGGGGRMAVITNECGVFCGDDENVLELDSEDGCMNLSIR